jgi:DNA-binding MarR family transcriptional regulator
MSDTSRIVDRLISKELVVKNTCEKDKRLVDITLSPKGLDLVDQLDQFNDRIDALLKGINASEAATMNQILDKIRTVHTSS